MQRKEIEKNYIEKINKLKKHDEAYFKHDKPIYPVNNVHLYVDICNPF